MNLSIRPETAADHRTVEELTREAFWNLHVPGCDEHYLVHIMRNHPDFIPELNFVAVDGDKIVGSILYTRSWLVDDANHTMETLTFGPLSVLPACQRQGAGTALIQHTQKLAVQSGCKAIIIYGHPRNYCKHGFKSARDYNISNAEGKYPCSLLVLELEPGALDGRNWKYLDSDVFHIDAHAAAEFDQGFAEKKKEYAPSQEEFSILCRAYIP